MPKIVIVGKCKFEYEILAVPKKMLDTPEPTEEGYLLAIEKFFPAIDRCDLVIVYAPDGVSEHMERDIDHARMRGKPIFRLVPLEEEITPFIRAYSRKINEYQEKEKLCNKLSKHKLEWVCSDCGAPSKLVKTGFLNHVKPECTACGSGSATAVRQEAEE